VNNALKQIRISLIRSLPNTKSASWGAIMSPTGRAGADGPTIRAMTTLSPAANAGNPNASTWPAGGWALALLALVAPTLLAPHDPPSVTFYNQALAVLGWGLWLSWLGGRPTSVSRGPGRTALIALCAALLTLAGLALWAGAFGPVPLGLGLMGGGMALAAALAAWSGWRAGCSAERDTLSALFFGGLAVAGVAGTLLALVQVFHPQWADGRWVAIPTMAGRAVGNLRQPNHFSTLMVFACVGVAWLGARGRLPVTWASAGLAAFIGVIVLTASRTGMVAMVLLTAWGVFDRRLPARLRWVLIGAPLVYGLAWGGMWLVSQTDQSVAFAAEARLHDGSDISSSRFKIWTNVLALIAEQPWTGVGYGRFNFAWSMTPFPGRPVAFFDHTHNIVLQWAVEFGLPVAALLLLLTLGTFVTLVRPVRAVSDEQVGLAGAAAVMVAAAGLHSLLEYPLWYAYFLLPTAFVFGLGLSARAEHASGSSVPGGASPPTQATSPAGALAGMSVAALAIWCALDYQAAANIYAPRPCAQAAAEQPGWLSRICPAGLRERIDFGRQMPWWGHQADYAWVNLPDEDEPSLPPEAFRRTTHVLLDARLMMAYARSLAEHGREDHARYVAQRLAEFRNARAKPWFQACDEEAEAGQARPFQCEAPQGTYTWRDVAP
jgi:O-antigen ligase